MQKAACVAALLYSSMNLHVGVHADDILVKPIQQNHCKFAVALHFSGSSSGFLTAIEDEQQRASLGKASVGLFMIPCSLILLHIFMLHFLWKEIMTLLFRW